MKIPNPIRMNDWPMRKFLISVLVLQISFYSLIFLDVLGFEIPILRELIGFLFLTFIPGFLILRILKLHKLTPIQSVLYSVGLSISFLILTGLFMNSLYPFFGIQKPISIIPLILTLTILTLLLCIICYIRDKEFSSSIYLNVNQQLAPFTLSLLLIPFLSFFGAYTMNVYDNNTLLLIILFIVSSLPLLIVFNKLPKELYGLAIFVASISILFHTNLISWYLWGWDIHSEYYFASLVKENAYWDFGLPYSYNSLPTIVLLAPIYSALTGLKLVWIFKIVFVVFFSLTPLGLYHIYKSQFDDKLISALAPFLFMFYYGFFKSAPDKQYIAEVFLILLLMLIIDKNIPRFSKKIMAIIFSFSLVVSHYGTSYLFVILLILVIAFLIVFRIKKESNIIQPGFATFFFVLTVSWFMFISGGVSFNNLAHLGNHIATNLFELLQTHPYRTGAGYATLEMPNLTWKIYKYICIILQIFIFLGVAKLLISMVKKENICRDSEFAAFSLFFYGFLAIQILLAMNLGLDRALQITLILLAPYAIIGCECMFKSLNNIFRYIYKQKQLFTTFNRFNPALKFFGVFLSIFLLFGSGFVFEATKNQYPMSFALNKSTAFPVFSTEEVDGALWLKDYAKSNRIYTYGKGKRLPLHRESILLSEFFIYKNVTKFYFTANTTKMHSQSYIYLGRFATKNSVLLGDRTFGWNKEYIALKKTDFYCEIISKENEIYTNGGSIIYYVS